VLTPPVEREAAFHQQASYKYYIIHSPQSGMSLFLSSLLLLLLGFYFVLNDLISFIEWDIIKLNSSRIVITFLFD
jgi:hypothetical protein